jgi:adenosyl cobinamide kinase/adenosyl cobinamide phosphate guanylyltransferase
MALGDDEAEAWIAEHAARCYGGWRTGAYAATLAEMESLMPRWREMYGPR